MRLRRTISPVTPPHSAGTANKAFNRQYIRSTHAARVATHQVSAVDETLFAGNGILTRAVAVVTSPPTANGSRKYATADLLKLDSGNCDNARRFLKWPLDSCTLKGLVLLLAQQFPQEH